LKRAWEKTYSVQKDCRKKKKVRAAYEMSTLFPSIESALNTVRAKKREIKENKLFS